MQDCIAFMASKFHFVSISTVCLILRLSSRSCSKFHFVSISTFYKDLKICVRCHSKFHFVSISTDFALFPIVGTFYSKFHFVSISTHPKYSPINPPLTPPFLSTPFPQCFSSNYFTITIPPMPVQSPLSSIVDPLWFLHYYRSTISATKRSWSYHPLFPKTPCPAIFPDGF